MNVWILSFILQNMCGPNVTPNNACFMVNDLDGDGDVDLADIAEFQLMEYRCGIELPDGPVCAFVETVKE